MNPPFCLRVLATGTNEASFIPFQHFLASHFHSSVCPQADLQVARPLAVSALNQLYLPVEGSSTALAQRLQPVLILEPHTGLVHSQLVSRELHNCKIEHTQILGV